MTDTVPHRFNRRQALLAMSGMAAASPSRSADRISFGVVPYLPVRRLIALYAPLIPTLERVFGKAVDLISAQDYRQHLQNLRARQFDVVADSLFLARIAQKELGHLPLARTQAGLESIIVAPVQTGLKSIKDLEGKTVALTDRISSLGVVGLRYLRDQGLDPGKKVNLLVSGSHSNSIHLMLAGQASAAIISKTTLAQVDPQLAVKVKTIATPPAALAAVVYHLNPVHKALQTSLTQQMLAFANHTETGRNFMLALSHGSLLEAKPKELMGLDPMVTEFYRQLTAA
jgi:phosphonate transport system substrate-binding protein